MVIQDAFPNEIKEIEHTCIPMSDGTRLAARIWMPKSAEEEPVPAILEFIPYRKRDFTAERDAANHRWFAGHGYACIRVDMRGSGDSDGLLLDEYIEQEQDDGLEIIKWIRNQKWCDGSVGMFGISWGGFNGLQISARQPEGLKAVVSVASTDDRYADDVHYMGGCLLGDNLSWASTMFAYNSSPPDPELVGDDWRNMWLERMDKSGLWVKNWLEHQIRDDFWKHGSICEDFSRVKTPIFAVSGWADGYSNAVFRLLKGLKSPCLGLIGPWSHKYPHFGVPGPAIGFLQECLRWWDYWLKEKETGIMDEPKLRVWLQDSVAPSTFYKERPGRWVGEDDWPSDNISEEKWRLGEGAKLLPSEDVKDKRQVAEKGRTLLDIQSPLSVGQFAGKWCSYSATPDLPGDQREEDGGSLVWQSKALDEPLDILGKVRARLSLSSNQETGMVAVRLSDVAEDGKATRVTYGILNLTHRESHENPKPLKPDKFYEVDVLLNDCAHRFCKNHSLRISVSTSLWPLAWPPPKPTCLTLSLIGSHLTLPLRAPRDADSKIQFEPPERAPGLQSTTLAEGDTYWRLRRDLGTNRSVMRVLKDEGKSRLDDINLTTSRSAYEEYRFEKDDFTSVSGKTIHKRCWERDGWYVSISTTTVLKCDEENFYIAAALDAWEGDIRIFSKNWKEAVPRHLV